MTVFMDILNYLNRHSFEKEDECRGLEELLAKHGILGDEHDEDSLTIEDAIRIKDDFNSFASNYCYMSNGE